MIITRCEHYSLCTDPLYVGECKKECIKRYKGLHKKGKETMFITMEVKQREIERLEKLLGEEIEDTEDLELAIRHIINHVEIKKVKVWESNA